MFLKSRQTCYTAQAVSLLRWDMGALHHRVTQCVSPVWGQEKNNLASTAGRTVRRGYVL